MPPRRRPATGLNAFTDAASVNKLQHIVSLLAERRGAAQVRAILLSLEQSEISASGDDAEEPQHTFKLAARLSNKSSDAEPANSDEDTPSPSPPPAPSKAQTLAA
jgi:hypothetical protein